MRAFIIHLLLVALVAPFIGCVLLFVLGPVLPFHDAMPREPMDMMLFAALIAPLMAWYIFVPIACISFPFFRFGARHSAKSLLFWISAWGIIGAATSILFVQANGFQSGLGPLIIVGAITGALIAPLHRRLWMQLHEELERNASSGTRI